MAVVVNPGLHCCGLGDLESISMFASAEVSTGCPSWRKSCWKTAGIDSSPPRPCYGINCWMMAGWVNGWMYGSSLFAAGFTPTVMLWTKPNGVQALCFGMFDLHPTCEEEMTNEENGRSFWCFSLSLFANLLLTHNARLINGGRRCEQCAQAATPGAPCWVWKGLINRPL